MEPFALKVPLAGRPIAFEVFRVLTWGHKRRRKTALAIDQNKKKGPPLAFEFPRPHFRPRRVRLTVWTRRPNKAANGVRDRASPLQASQSASYSFD